MKLVPDAIQAQSISSYGPGWLAINGEKVSSSIVISVAGARFDWDCSSFEALQASHFERLSSMDAELIIFGSGERIRFPPAQMLQSLYAKRIGVETMDTQAACRTYNFLAADGRKVVGAFLL